MVLDHEIAVNIVEIDLLAQVFLNNIRDKSFKDLYERFLKKQLKPNKGLMEETLMLAEKMLREIVYIYSKKDSIIHTHLLDLTRAIIELPEFEAIYSLVKSCKDFG